MSAVVTQAVELLPCPFCGGEAGIRASLFADRGPPTHCAQCTACGSHLWRDSEAEAITAWNQRHRSEAVEELVKALKEARGQVVGFMLECGHSPETAVANVARLDAVLSKHRGEQG